MSADNDDQNHFIVSPAVLGVIFTGAVGLGAGGYGLVGPQIDKVGLLRCVDTSATALSVAAQHGDEILDLRKIIADTRALVYDRTQYRYSTEDHFLYAKQQSEINRIQDLRIEQIEREHKNGKMNQ